MAARFEKYLNPVLAALRDLGGSARPGEVYDWIASRLGITDEERAVQNQSGVSRFENDVAWARFYLYRGGLLDSSRFGVWSLTEQGRSGGALSDDQIADLLRRVRSRPAPSTGTPTREPVVTPGEDQESEVDAPPNSSVVESPVESYRERILTILRSLPPAGFERFCQRLLRESGFQQVRVTGRSGDGGIDGVGVLQLNAFVSFKVLFQSKRYAGTVSAAQVRDFRGAMTGRTDKGLMITTGTFSPDAKAEAVRDGVPPIELVDGQGLVALLEKLELGLRPLRTYEVDKIFFDEFSSL